MPPQQGDQCIFCQLIANPEQLKLVGETENFYAWLDINPRAKGHSMVVPKEHVESIMEFSPSKYQEAMLLTREVVEKAKKGLDADGASVTVNIDEAGGQMMPHAYIQIFPRFQEEENSGTPTGAIFPHREELTEELDDIKDDMSSVSIDFQEETIEAHPESQRHIETGEQETESEETEPGETEDEEQEEERIERGKSLEWV